MVENVRLQSWIFHQCSHETIHHLIDKHSLEWSILVHWPELKLLLRLCSVVSPMLRCISNLLRVYAAWFRSSRCELHIVPNKSSATGRTQWLSDVLPSGHWYGVRSCDSGWEDVHAAHVVKLDICLEIGWYPTEAFELKFQQWLPTPRCNNHSTHWFQSSTKIQAHLLPWNQTLFSERQFLVPEPR